MVDSIPVSDNNMIMTADTSRISEVSAGVRDGVIGMPVPYELRTDDVMTLLLLACFIVTVVSLANSWTFVARQAKLLVRQQNEGTTVMSETSSEVRFQLFLLMQTSLLYAIFFYFYAMEHAGGIQVVDSQYMFIGAFLLLSLGSYLLRGVLYTLVNNIFFDAKRNKEWLLSLLFISATEGVMLFPAILLQVYFDLSLPNAIVYVVGVLVLVKILSFYKCFTIFFKRKGSFLQIFLYFCTLEIVPLFLLWGILRITSNYLNVNF